MRSRLKTYSILFGLIVIISAIGLFLIVNYLDPYGSSLNIVLFYFDFSILVSSFASLCGFQLRQAFGQREQAGRYLVISVRQAIWFSILIVGSLILQSFGFFNMLNAVLLVLAFVFLESYFLYTSHE